MDGIDQDSSTCPVHPGKPISSFCVQHQTGMCIACLLTSHKDCINHVEPIEHIQTQVTPHSENIVELHQQLEDAIKDVKNKKVEWIKKYDKVEKDLLFGIRQRKIQLTQKVEKLALEAIDMSKSVLEENKKKYQHDIEVIKDFERQLDEIKKVIQKKKLTDTSIPAMKKKLEQIEKGYIQEKLNSNDVKFRFYVSDAVLRLETMFDTFGELSVEDVPDHPPGPKSAPSNENIFDLNYQNANGATNRGTLSRESVLFFYSEANDVYTQAEPDPLLHVTKTESKAPPLPNMDIRILSPPIIPGEPNPMFTSARWTSCISDGQIETSSEWAGSQSSTDGVDEAFADIPAGDLRHDKIVSSGLSYCSSSTRQLDNMSTTGVFFYEPGESRDNGEVNRTDRKLSKSDAAFNHSTRASIPVLPIRKARTVHGSPSWPMCNDKKYIINNENTLDDHKVTGINKDNRNNNDKMKLAGLQTSTTTSRQQTDPNRNRVGETSTKVSTTSGQYSNGHISQQQSHDSGIVVSQDLTTSHLSSMKDHTHLSIPQLPMNKQRRKCSEPTLPIVRRRENPMQPKPHLSHVAKRKSCSETDLTDKTMGAMSSNSTLKDKTDHQAASTDPKSNPKMGKSSHRSVTRKIKSFGSSTWRGKPKELYTYGTMVDIPIDPVSPGQALASAILPSRIILSPDRAKTRNASFITGLTALDGGNILTCDIRNNTVELFDSYGLLRDIYEMAKPFGCCYLGNNKIAVTSRENHILRLFVIENWKIKLCGERAVETSRDVFGLSYSYGFLCVSCLTEVRLLREEGTDKEITVCPYERGRKRKTPKPYFMDVQYALMERLEERFYIFTSDIRKKRVTSVSLNGMVVWNQANIEAKCLVYYAQQVIVTTDKYLVFLNATSGDQIREIVYGIPKCPWGLAVENGPLPWLLVSGSGKTCHRQVMRIGLCSLVPRKSSLQSNETFF